MYLKPTVKPVNKMFFYLMKSNVDFSNDWLQLVFFVKPGGVWWEARWGDNSGLRLALVLFSVFCLKLINRAEPPQLSPTTTTTTVAGNSDCEFCGRLSTQSQSYVK